MSTQTDERKKELRDAFIDARGYWNVFWDALLDMDEDFFEAYTRFSSVPWMSGPLDPKIKEFVYIAVDAAATHLYVPGSASTSSRRSRTARLPRRSWRCSSSPRRSGSTPATSACRSSSRSSRRRPAYLRELSSARRRSRPTSPRSAATGTRSGTRSCRSTRILRGVHAVLVGAVGDGRARAEGQGADLHRLRRLGDAPLRAGPQAAIQNAIGYGATREEILEVIELASVIGIHSCTVGVPILVEELAAGERPDA